MGRRLGHTFVVVVVVVVVAIAVIVIVAVSHLVIVFVTVTAAPSFTPLLSSLSSPHVSAPSPLALPVVLLPGPFSFRRRVSANSVRSQRTQRGEHPRRMHAVRDVRVCMV